MVAREGTAPLTALGALAVGVSFSSGALWPTMLVWALLLAVLWIYYEPRPRCPPLPNALVCSMSGAVSRVDGCWNPWLNAHCLRIRVTVAAPQIGTVWGPTEGKIQEFWTKAAPFDGPAGRATRDRSPNCYALHIRTDEMQHAVLALSSNWPVSRLKLDFGPGNRAGQGRRMGFAYFIGYVDLLLDPGSEAVVQVGDEVLAGETVLATFADRDPEVAA